MRKSRALVAGAAALALTFSAAACGGNDDKGSDSSGGAKPEFNAALTQVFNPSEKKGGTIRLANSGDWDTLDPGETYYGYSWNFLRLYGRGLLMFKPVPGAEGNSVTPDLAEGLGTPSDGGKTWTYKIRKGIKFEDGTEVTSKDVKYAVLRSIDKETFPNGPAYFEGFLNLPEGYKGPYKSKGVNTDSAITTPDDQTIVFHLKQAFGGFDYFAALPQTVPVPEAKDTGAKYKEHVVSTGPYKFETNELGKSFKLVRNDKWDAATDPNRKALPDAYDVQLNVNADDIDNRLLSGDLDVDVVGTGVQPATLGRVVGDPTLKASTDNPTLARLWYTSINPTVAPLDNVDCRKAVEYAADKVGYQTAYGGPLAGGDITGTILPPMIPGYEKFDLYPSADGTGDVEKAKEHLKACGQPNGFETNIAYRAERPKEKATAEALQQSLARVGIKLTLKPFPQGDYFSQYAGNPPYVKNNKLGLNLNGWGADWNDGFGFLSQIVDSRVIRETGGSSNTSVRIPEVDGLLDKASSETDAAKRDAYWAQIDKRVMEEAVILPGVTAKSLLIRPKTLTNVFVSDAYNMYDYLSLGVA
ncbi:peptide ABC transporter substrate-binding protein [Actinoplanes lobatus]|uniref:Peptide ABC transporter substrate-binding protein n=1 Tax=Actinoplanes lobatus TaxID=113568 RepID=A0A7W7MET2_9ACTN|nr:ABC transporter substrate-binding protein [Actinoplanes lobatus]MBB4747571.1 peptide/nickel transport system substrate-binding protein [Actinoplanes lobatus]GGN74114.1 peptide ABC transporter substrate-binding protein [Actinoplanes lobatus]GIE39868.1 peptide ABC transporter substrate-binding protein [Actinoplanes lobatus]